MSTQGPLLARLQVSYFAPFWPDLFLHLFYSLMPAEKRACTPVLFLRELPLQTVKRPHPNVFFSPSHHLRLWTLQKYTKRKTVGRRVNIRPPIAPVPPWLTHQSCYAFAIFFVRSEKTCCWSLFWRNFFAEKMAKYGQKWFTVMLFLDFEFLSILTPKMTLKFKFDLLCST